MRKSMYTEELLDIIEAELKTLELPIEKNVRKLANRFLDIYKLHSKERLFTLKDIENAIFFGQTIQDCNSVEGKRKKIKFILSIAPSDSDFKLTKKERLAYNNFNEPPKPIQKKSISL